jgi:hypothetical protein
MGEAMTTMSIWVGDGDEDRVDFRVPEDFFCLRNPSRGQEGRITGPPENQAYNSHPRIPAFRNLCLSDGEILAEAP